MSPRALRDMPIDEWPCGGVRADVGASVAVPAVLTLVWRLVDEERFLVGNLDGYDAYRRKTRYRLIPGVW